MKSKHARKPQQPSKFLVDDGRYDFAMSGSLLGVELEDVRSVPVGYQSEVVMFPLDFEEFCWSQNVDGKIFDMLKECYEKNSQWMILFMNISCLYSENI